MGPLLEHNLSLPDGERVRLRMARPRDYARLTRLLGAAGAGGELEAARLVRFDPRRRAVLCATGLVDGAECVLGVGAIHLARPPAPAPDLLVLEPGRPDELAELLRAALLERAASYAARRAA